MSASFEKINYNLRPNKCIERKMMSEAFSRLSHLDHLNNYRYIGFGSPYFADFILFHKNLGITDLISIEKEINKKDRFEFNIPYSGIKMKYDESSKILPNLELNLKKNIVWLDYDDQISDYMFFDIDTFFFNSSPGSFFILSVNVEQNFMTIDDINLAEIDSEKIDSKELIKKFRLNNLIERVGKSRIPSEYMNLNMNTKNLTNVAYEMIYRQIVTTLNTRNGTNQNKIEYKQLFNFIYKDNATILTVGGIIYDKTQRAAISKMCFENLPFIKTSYESYKIQCPNLTFREIKALDKALPNNMKLHRGKFLSKALQEIPLIENDIKNYAKVYRYYPNFTETNL